MKCKNNKFLRVLEFVVKPTLNRVRRETYSKNVKVPEKSKFWLCFGKKLKCQKFHEMQK